MKKFLLKLLWFILPIVVIAYPLDLFISNNLRKANDIGYEYEIWNDIYNGTAICDIAVFGSSRAANHYNSKILEDSLHKKVYNFGIAGQFFETHYLRYLEFIKYNQKPQLIIISLETFSLTKRPIIHLPEQFLPHLLFNKNIEKYTADYENSFSKLDYYLPLIRYAGKPLSLSKSFQNFFYAPDPSIKNKYKGFVGLPNQWNEENDKKYHKKVGYEIELNQYLVNLFEQFIKDCKNRGIAVALVYPPETIENQQWETNREEIMNYYQQIAAQNDCLFLDYSKDEISFQKDNFFDSNHLTGKAADLFTRKLASKLRELGY